MREPPPVLPADANAFWNDRASNNYGEFSVGPGLYRFQDELCHTARVTSINDATHQHIDRILLYCSTPAGTFALNPGATCRSSGNPARVTCRTPEGDDFVLQPLGPA